MGFASSTLTMLEVGGRRRLSEPLRQICRYSNADREETDVRIDVRFIDGRLLAPDESFDFVLASFVLSQIAEREHRTELLRELCRATKADGALLLLDDFDLSSPTSMALPVDAFFHSTRLGAECVHEIRTAGWRLVQTATLREPAEELCHDFPAIVASRRRPFCSETTFDAYFHLHEALH